MKLFPILRSFVTQPSRFILILDQMVFDCFCIWTGFDAVQHTQLGLLKTIDNESKFPRHMHIVDQEIN